jgi:hypothetical protein
VAKKTKEELSNAAKERARVKRELHERLPWAQLEKSVQWSGGESRLIISLESGEEAYVNVFWKGTPFLKCDESGLYEGTIILDNPQALVEFIAALCARYNHMVEKLNARSERISVSRCTEACKRD